MKKFSLFLNTSNSIQIGLISSTGTWISFFESQDVKNISLLDRIHNHIEDNKLDLENLEYLIVGQGPGSYTGVRLTHCISSVFEWQKKAIRTFYSFEIPSLLGITKGIWLTRAFKKEIFIHEWNNHTSNQTIVQEKNVDLLKEKLEKYSPHTFTFDQTSLPIKLETKVPIQYTNDLLKENMVNLFSLFKNQDHLHQPFYFRPPEKEFSYVSKNK